MPNLPGGAQLGDCTGSNPWAILCSPKCINIYQWRDKSPLKSPRKQVVQAAMFYGTIGPPWDIVYCQMPLPPGVAHEARVSQGPKGNKEPRREGENWGLNASDESETL